MKGKGIAQGFPGEAAARWGWESVVLELGELSPAGLRKKIRGLDPGLTRWLQITDNTTRQPLGVDSAGKKPPKALGVCIEPGCLGLNANSVTHRE